MEQLYSNLPPQALQTTLQFGRGGAAQVLNGAIAAALFNLIYDYLLSQRVKWYAMCPWLDLLNHRGTVEVRSWR